MSITLTLSGDFEEVFLTFTQNAGIARYNLDNDEAALELVTEQIRSIVRKLQQIKGVGH